MTMSKGASMKPSNIQILILRLAIGVLFLNIAAEKYTAGWLTNAEPLRQSLVNYRQQAGGVRLFYLEHVALPYAGIWAKLMTVGEACVAISLIIGLLVRLASSVAMFMVLNFHAANGNLLGLDFFASPWAALLITGFLIMFLARAGRWAGVDALLPDTKTMFW